MSENAHADQFLFCTCRSLYSSLRFSHCVPVTGFGPRIGVPVYFFVVHHSLAVDPNFRERPKFTELTNHRRIHFKLYNRLRNNSLCVKGSKVCSIILCGRLDILEPRKKVDVAVPFLAMESLVARCKLGRLDKLDEKCNYGCKYSCTL